MLVLGAGAVLVLGAGTARAVGGCVGARTFKELEAWQAADGLRRDVIAMTATGRASRDFKFVDQIRRAANSACANIAEGFGRYQHKEFGQFVSIARGSLAEVQDHIVAGAAMGYWSAATAGRLDAEAAKALRLTAGLLKHLHRTKAPSTST
ncbi:MAG TPA: four helix bundle protein [Vicinamibacterales bacterium]